MTPENKAFLEANRHHYDTVIKAGYVRHLNANEREGMQRIMREEFQPGYHTDLWCGPCLFDMVKLLYTRYDQWLSEQPKEIIVAASFPKIDKPNDTPNSDNRTKRRNRR